MKNQNLSYQYKTQRKHVYLLVILTVCLFTLTQLSTDAYISRPYTITELVSESTNIVFATISDVNTKRKTADFKVEENIKGKSEFDVIKIRYDVFKGEKDHRKEIDTLLKKGEPIIVLYLKEGGRIDSLAHTRGKWFQLQVAKDKNRGWVRWSFTHTEVKLNQFKVSRRDSTPELQKELRALLKGGVIRLFLLNRRNYQEEHSVISGINRVGDRWLACEQTTEGDLSELEKTDILWLGYRAIDDGRYHLNKNQEKQIRDFVKNGGIVIVSGQDSDDNRPCGSGWLAEPLKGVESSVRNDFQPTAKAGNLFKSPHRIRSGQLSLDDSWSGWNDKFEVLATTNNGKEIVVAKLKYGKGMYLITNMRNDNKSNTSKNRPLIENLTRYAVAALK